MIAHMELVNLVYLEFHLGQFIGFIEEVVCLIEGLVNTIHYNVLSSFSLGNFCLSFRT